MENIFLKRLEFKAFEEDSVFSKIEGLNKFNSLNFKTYYFFQVKMELKIHFIRSNRSQLGI